MQSLGWMKFLDWSKFTSHKIWENENLYCFSKRGNKDGFSLSKKKQVECRKKLI